VPLLTIGVEVELVSTGEVVEKKTLLVDGSSVVHITMMVDELTVPKTAVMTGGVPSGVGRVANVLSEEVETLPEASLDCTTM